MSEQEDVGWQRLDKWLWCARFMRQRSDCAALVGQGGLRINRMPTDKPHARLRVGDVITLPLRDTVRVIEVRALAERRGPASAAAMLYCEIAPAPIQARGRDPCGRGQPAASHVAWPIQARGRDPCGGAETASYPLPSSDR